MSLEKVSEETSYSLFSVSASLGEVDKPLALGFNRFVETYLGRVENRFIDEKALTLFSGWEGYISIETFNRLGHCVLRMQVGIHEDLRRAFVEDENELFLLTEEEGQLLLEDIHDTLQHTPIDRLST